MDYLTVKWLHILSSTILFGTGLGSAFFMFIASRGKHPTIVHFTVNYVVLADWLFTAPAVVFQLLSGLYLVHLGGHNLTDAWLSYGIALYLFAGICWLPVVWIQIKMRDLAAEAAYTHTELSEQYRRYFRWWVILGSLAFPAIIVVFWLMAVKPT